jgi:hypothetical protein
VIPCMIPWRTVGTEAAVLAVFAFGLAVSRRLRRPWAAPELVLMYALGLLFEVLTAPMWRYHWIALRLPFWGDGDISAAFPLGWTGWILAATAIAERWWRAAGFVRWWTRHLALMAVWLVLGGAGETFFYRIGMIEYVATGPGRVNFVLGQAEGLPPTAVLLGYGGLPPLVSQLFRWLERALARRSRRP